LGDAGVHFCACVVRDNQKKIFGVALRATAVGRVSTLQRAEGLKC
jgi:hypothetical protein